MDPFTLELYLFTTLLSICMLKKITKINKELVLDWHYLNKVHDQKGKNVNRKRSRKNINNYTSNN